MCIMHCLVDKWIPYASTHLLDFPIVGYLPISRLPFVFPCFRLINANRAKTTKETVHHREESTEKCWRESPGCWRESAACSREASKMMDTGGASSGGARRGISAADVAASGWLQRRSSACSREASKMMGRGGASSGGAPLRRPGSSSTRRC
jgi:hypothetical protein